jgi:xylose isomerase
MLVILKGGGFKTGGINFDAKTRRNSTDLIDIFHAHIGGMDMFARALLAANAILENGKYNQLLKDRYKTFDAGKGKQFEQGKLTLKELHDLAVKNGEPEQLSGQQEYYENLVSSYL